jgi:hypothetical protein
MTSPSMLSRRSRALTSSQILSTHWTENTGTGRVWNHTGYCPCPRRRDVIPTSLLPKHIHNMTPSPMGHAILEGDEGRCESKAVRTRRQDYGAHPAKRTALCRRALHCQARRTGVGREGVGVLGALQRDEGGAEGADGVGVRGDLDGDAQGVLQGPDDAAVAGHTT